MTRTILALDFGGTKLSAALFTAQDSTPRREDAKAQRDSSSASWRLRALALNSSLRLITPDGADAAYELAAMVALARELLEGRAPDAIGVSFGGPVDYASGVVRLSHHVRGWESVPLRERLAAEFGCPVAVDNDANVAALGEHRFGAGRGVADLMYVTVSTGVGGGWILGGRPWRGHEGLAGEIGHTVADPAGPLCLCGKRGCVERLASGPYMAGDLAQERDTEKRRGAQRNAEEGRDTELTEGLEGQEKASTPASPPSSSRPLPLTGQDVAERAAAGDEAARAILLRGAWALGVGLGNAANLINPQRFVLGGGVTKAGEAWWAEVRRSAAATALPEVRFDVVPAALGDDAPLWGALALAEGLSADWAD
ncbi:MAG: ROK family protein [Candidatus Promineofilum sp.]|nr:ROK family protein [Promineifilum sp.]